MTKEQLIEKISDLYDTICNGLYDQWSNRSTLTSWEKSWEGGRADYMQAEKEKLIKDIEESF